MIAALLMLVGVAAAGPSGHVTPTRALSLCAARVGATFGAVPATREIIYDRIAQTCAPQAQRLSDQTLATNRRLGISEGDGRINAGDTVVLALQDAADRVQSRLARLTARAQERAARPQRCGIARQPLIGAWSDDSIAGEKSEIFPAGDSREIQFVFEAGRPVYREYLHQRPAGEGRWALRGCLLTITDQGGVERYRIVGLHGGRLVLRSPGETTVQRFHRIK